MPNFQRKVAIADLGLLVHGRMPTGDIAAMKIASIGSKEDTIYMHERDVLLTLSNLWDTHTHQPF